MVFTLINIMEYKQTNSNFINIDYFLFSLVFNSETISRVDYQLENENDCGTISGKL